MLKNKQYPFNVCSFNVPYHSLNILDLNNIYIFQMLKFIHKVFFFDKESFNYYFFNLIIEREDCSRRPRMRLPVAILEIGRWSTIFQSCKIYNELPSNLLTPMSKYLLKKKFYEYAMKKALILL